MATSTGFPRNLRYSPVNWLIVDWGFNGVAFAECGLPQPGPCPEPLDPLPEPCVTLPIKEAINTYDWALWLPEVIVGMEDPDEEIAAAYVRSAAIDFAKKTRVLQRQIVIPLQPGLCTYPVEPYEGEQVIGIIGAAIDEDLPCECRTGCSMVMPNGLAFNYDIPRNEITLEAGRPGCCTCGARVLRLLVWAAPTEFACEHDVFLYDMFREEITLAARRNYAHAVHFRDRWLMQSLPSVGQVEQAKALAKNKAVSRHSWQRQQGVGMWATPSRNYWRGQRR